MEGADPQLQKRPLRGNQGHTVFLWSDAEAVPFLWPRTAVELSIQPLSGVLSAADQMVGVLGLRWSGLRPRNTA